MVTFDSALPGTSETDWAADVRLHNRPPLDLRDADELVVVAAHPDDETLGAGGLISHCAKLGMPVRVICVTDGADSHAGDAGIVEQRAAELVAAVQELAPQATVELLGFSDGQTKEQRAEIHKVLSARFTTVSLNAVIAVTWRGDGHRDHRIVGEIVTEIARGRLLLEYPIWMWHWAHPQHTAVPWDRMVSLKIDIDAKVRALDQYSSQTTGDNPMLHTDFLEHAKRDWELFIVADRTLGQDYFDSLYAQSKDPWRFRTRWYEKRKRGITVASIPQANYRRGLEIGCSIGLLTDLLATRCDDLISIDISEEAVEQARSLVGSRAAIRCQDVLQEFPTGEFDLIVLSEVGYYWRAEELQTVLENIDRSLTKEGHVLACHWRHPVTDYPLSGDEVHQALGQQKWNRLISHIEDDFILEVFSTDPRSVAQREGLA